MRCRLSVGRCAASGVLLVSLVQSKALGQDVAPRPRDPSIATAAHERLSFFEGTWLVEPSAETRAVPGTPLQQEETCAWLTGGRRHMICRAWRTDSGDGARRERIQILSYQEQSATYLAHFAFPSGDVVTYVGRVEGDRWVMNMQPTPLLPSNERYREIITRVDGGLRFVEERSVDGGPWVITEDFRYRRAK
jgi:hypothetical protein